MSTALLKKSLELVDTDFVQKRTVIKSKVKEKKVFSEIKIKNKGRKTKNNRSVADVKQDNLNTVEKIRKQLKRKDIKRNYNRKLKLLRKPPNKNVVNKLLEHLGYGDSAKEKGEEEQKTAFTEEDFLKFEKEYVDTD